MTCIIGLEHNGTIYMGGDSAAVDDWQIRKSLYPKVFIKGDLIIGYTTSFRMGQLLEYNLAIPEPKSKWTTSAEDMQYIVAELVPAIRACLKDGGYSTITDNCESGGTFMVGYHAGLYTINSDFSVLCHHDEFNAIGIGFAFAIGALAAMKRRKPEIAIMRALEIAGEFSNGVCGPYYVYSL